MTVALWLQSLLIAWLLLRMGHKQRDRRPPIMTMSVAILGALLIQIPVHDGISLAMALRALWGDPSASTVALIILSLAGRTPDPIARGWRGPAVIALLGVCLYPLSLGLGDLDPYRWGYQPLALTAVLGMAGLVAWWRGQSFWLLLLSFDLLVFATHLPASPNLWDTLLDPLLVGAMALMTLMALIRGGKTLTQRP